MTCKFIKMSPFTNFKILKFCLDKFNVFQGIQTLQNSVLAYNNYTIDGSQTVNGASTLEILRLQVDAQKQTSAHCLVAGQSTASPA